MVRLIENHKIKKTLLLEIKLDLKLLDLKDEKNDDKEIINTSLKSLQNIKYSSGTLTIGNVEIFNLLLISKLRYSKTVEIKIIKTFLERKIF